MHLRDLIESLVMSQPSDWHVIPGGPSACFIPNASITMAWGRAVVEDFKEPWANKFSDPRASSHHVDVFFNGALVYRTMYVAVDGGRAYLPLPLEYYGGAVPLRYSAFIALLDRLSTGGASQYPSYYERAGLRSIDAEWPFPRQENTTPERRS